MDEIVDIDEEGFKTFFADKDEFFELLNQFEATGDIARIVDIV